MNDQLEALTALGRLSVNDLTDSSRRLERLTRWLIGLTIALILLTVPLVLDVIVKWLRR